ncbi:MAG: PLP-dependent aminotransferase family protein, partial [Eubacterium sp.]|nr:PLP-dependent aminotransferase family protein [Candidatus Colimonas fimequi]
SAMDNTLFPYNLWRKCVNNVLYHLETRSAMDYPSRIGELRLRKEIAAYLKRARDVNCSPEQIVITGGQQYSMVIIADMFRDNKKFTMEDPGYDGIRHIFANHEFKITGAPVDENGIILDTLENLDTKLLYLTPSHHFPTGGVIPVGNRYKLIDWAERNDAYIIEDDYDSELRYYTNPVPSLQSLDTRDRVIYTGCFSKSLAPSMRIAYIVLPPSLMERYNAYYHRYHSQVDVIHQLTLAEFMASGHYDRHINKLRTNFKRKQEIIIDSLHRTFGSRVSIRGEGAGIYLIIRIDGPFNQEELVARAKAAGILVYPTRACYMNVADCPENELLMGFATLDPESIDQILATLKEVWEIK